MHFSWLKFERVIFRQMPRRTASKNSTIRLLPTLVFALMFCGTANHAIAAEIGITPHKSISYKNDCYLKGEIKTGDADRLKNVITDRYNVHCSLYLDSLGGNLVEALKIIELITQTTTPTYVAKDAVCNSACALIFMAGRGISEGEKPISDRNMVIGAQIGFHQPSREKLNVDPELESVLIDPTYQSAVSQMSQLFYLSGGQTNTGKDSESILSNELLRRMLSKNHSEIYKIERVEDLIISGIALEEIGNIFRYYNRGERRHLVGADGRNVCDNYYWKLGNFGRNKYFSYDTNRDLGVGAVVQIDGTKMQRFDGYEGLEGTTQSCFVEEGGAFYRVRFEDEEFTMVPLVYGLRRNQEISTIRINYGNENSESAIIKNNTAPQTVSSCLVFRNKKVIDMEFCNLIAENIKNGKVTKIFEWPSGAKTTVTTVGNRLSINGAKSAKIENSNGYTCAKNTNTGNYFCVKPW